MLIPVGFIVAVAGLSLSREARWPAWLGLIVLASTVAYTAFVANRNWPWYQFRPSLWQLMLALDALLFGAAVLSLVGLLWKRSAARRILTAVLVGASGAVYLGGFLVYTVNPQA